MMNYEEYTERQKGIIEGSVPITRAGLTEIRRIYSKAVYRMDAEVIDFAEAELNRRWFQSYKRLPYTERQLKVITGEVPLTEADYNILTKIVHKAREQSDVKVVELAESELKRRDPLWVFHIDGYNKKQTRIIIGLDPLEETHNAFVRGLDCCALRLGDYEISDWTKAELDRRGINDSRHTCTRFCYNDVASGVVSLDKLQDNERTRILHEAYQKGDEETVNRIESKIEEWFLSHRALHYTDTEKRIIKGLIPVSSVNQYILNSLLERLKLDDSRAVKKLIEEVESEFERRKERKTARKYEYTEKQEKIIVGEIPIYKVDSKELKVIVNKAEFNNDPDIVEYFKKELEARNIQTNEELPYTETEQLIINQAKTQDRKRKSKAKTIAEVNNPTIEQKSDNTNQINGKSDQNITVKIANNTSIIELEASEHSSQKSNEKDFKSSVDLQYSDFELRIIAQAKSGGIKKKSDISYLPEYEPLINDLHEEESYKPTLNNLVKGLKNEAYYQELDEYRQSQKNKIQNKANTGEAKLRRPFTKRQKQIINGEIPMDAVRNQEIAKIIKKSRYFEDFDTANRLEEYLKESIGDEYSAGSYNRVNEEGENMNTEDMILHGEIPYEELNLRDLKRIERKAKENGDIEVLSLIETLIMEKEADKREKEKYRSYNRQYFGSTYEGPRKTKEWAIDILESRADPTMCRMEDLLNIKRFSETLNDPVYLRVAELLIAEMKDKSSVYTVHSKEEAMKVIEENTIVPIRKFK